MIMDGADSTHCPEERVVPPSREVAHTEIDDRVDLERAPGAKRVYDFLFPDSGS